MPKRTVAPTVTKHWVRSRWRAMLRRKKIDHRSGCWIWTGGRTGSDYGAWSESPKNGPQYIKLVHRMSAVLWLDFKENSPLFVMHLCNRTACFNPKHLAIGTQADNIQYASKMDRKPRCEWHPMAKLNNMQVKKIRIMCKSGMSNGAIARVFGVSHYTIFDIRRGRSWTKLK